MTDHLPSNALDIALERVAEYRKTRGTISMPYQAYMIALADEIEAARITAEYWKAEHLAGNAEIERLRTALRGISTCSTCEACRGAATRVLDPLAAIKLAWLVDERLDRVERELGAHGRSLIWCPALVGSNPHEWTPNGKCRHCGGERPSQPPGDG
jgi:hypothetical protein